VRALVGNRSYAPFDALLDALQRGDRHMVATGLAGGSTALILAELLRRHDGPALVLLRDRAAATAFRADLDFFLREPDGSATNRLFDYPAYDVAPFESVSPHQAITAARMACLHALADHPTAITLAPVEAVMNGVLSSAAFFAGCRTVRVGDQLDRGRLMADLLDAGYRITSLVEDVGEVAVRGDIIDVFVPGGDDPVRLETFGDEVESIRFFNPSTQVSKAHLPALQIFPANEAHLGAANAERFAARVKDLADAQDVPKPRRDRLVEEVMHHIPFPGIEFFTPLLHEGMETIFDYLGGKALIVMVEPAEVEAAVDAFAEKVAARHERAREASKLCVDADALYLDADAWRRTISSFRQLHLGREVYADNAPPVLFAADTHRGLREEILARATDAHMLTPLVARLRRWLAGEGRAFLVCRSLAAADRLERLLQNYDVAAEVRPEQPFRAALSGGQGLTSAPILLGDLSAGFVLPGLDLAVVTEEEIFGERRRADTYTRRKTELLSSFADLAEGDFLVHVKHGVGIYRGLRQFAVGGLDAEFLHVEYASGDKLYLPVDRLSAVQRFIGAGTAPKIDRLGGTAWEKTTRGARRAAHKLAKELLALYAARLARSGFAFPPPDETYREFEATFPYEETPDQDAAIRDVTADLVTDRPADRLICGDVGFGKTEVAMRAAFLAVLGGKQVAVLTPTTTLAFQHFNTFGARMGPFGVNVEMLSRFTEPRKRKEVAQKLEAGQIDVVIGTHMLLGKTARFRNLGLLIVDEEQHFGVAQKEKIKQLAQTVDVFTLTATPIPRTLHMSLAGIRDLSVINTPPEDRQAIRTFVTRYDEDTIREALERELARGGQAFFIHNRVKSIDTFAARIQRLVPRARVAVGHGQMDERQIERLMIDFATHQFDVLVCTTIVESGLDFPEANTIIIDRADALGLAQLYQLRGRVGRSKRRAYCYLLVPPVGLLTAEARKRLAVLRTFTELGSGYKIAVRDLEIRGAGNLLGPEQSGQIGAVGFEMYTHLLEQEIKRLRGEEVVEPFECEVSMHVPAYLPENYVSDVHLRLNLYKRISDARDDAEIDSLLAEITDRFGRPPAPVRHLLRIVALRRRAEKLRIKKIEAGIERIAFELDQTTPVHLGRMVQLIVAEPARFSLSPDGKLYERTGGGDVEAVFGALEEGLQRLADCV